MGQPESNITAIVETPKGSAQKYDYEPDTKCFKLKKILPAGMVFPFDFGFIPATKGEDGNPLDIIIISEVKSFPGCCMDCRIVGGIKAEQTERDEERMRNDRFIGIPVVSQLFATIKDIDDLPKDILTQMEHFFKNYNEQAGKQFNPLERINANEALKLIEQGKK